MLRESRSQSHREHLITKTKPRAPNCKNQCSLHVTNCLSSILKKSLEKQSFMSSSIYYGCVLPKKCRPTQTMCIILNTDFLVFPFVGSLHLSYRSILVSFEGNPCPAQPLPPLQDSTLPCCILGLYILTGPSHSLHLLQVSRTCQADESESHNSSLNLCFKPKNSHPLHIGHLHVYKLTGYSLNCLSSQVILKQISWLYFLDLYTFIPTYSLLLLPQYSLV